MGWRLQRSRLLGRFDLFDVETGHLVGEAEFRPGGREMRVKHAVRRSDERRRYGRASDWVTAPAGSQASAEYAAAVAAALPAETGLKDEEGAPARPDGAE